MLVISHALLAIRKLLLQFFSVVLRKTILMTRSYTENPEGLAEGNTRSCTGTLPHLFLGNSLVRFEVHGYFMQFFILV